MSAPLVALATSSDYPELPAGEQRLLHALRARGVEAVPAVWSEAAFDWRRCAAVVLRSCWDYHLRASEFLAWLTALETAGIGVFNPPAVVRWNIRKSYLLDLAARGVRIADTFLPSSSEEAEALLAGVGWGAVVVKPLVSSTAHETWRAPLPLAGDVRARLRRAIASGPVLLQPFLEAIERDGELSLVFLGGHYSHAVRKRPKPGDFRVQAEHGGSVEAAAPSATLIAAATRAVAAAPGPQLYARVDGLAEAGDLMVMELELIEPELFLDHDAEAPARLAAALLDQLEGT